jgi:plasmid stability protein
MMAQILVRKIDDQAMERLRMIAHDRKTSVEGLARAAIEQAAQQRTKSEMRDLLSDFENFSRLLPKSDLDSTVILRALRDGDETDD